MDCTNQEIIDPDLVITKLTLTVHNDDFGLYGRCNICGANGTDPFSKLPCTPGHYLCQCALTLDPTCCTPHGHD